MAHTTMRKRMQAVKNRWTESERKYRAAVSRRRCAALLARFEAMSEDASAYWAAGAMSLSDVQRIAG